MIKGYVINKSVRSKYIFKPHMSSGERVGLDILFEKYKYKDKYEGDFNVDFLEWLEKNKVPEDFEIVVESIEEVEEVLEASVEELAKKPLDIHPDRKYNPSKITPKEISELKIKDNPKNIIGRVNSIHKLRRALTACKNRPGKGTLYKLIKIRINEIK